MQIAYQQNHRVKRGADLKTSLQYANTGLPVASPRPLRRRQAKKRCPKRHVDSTELHDAVFDGDAGRVELLEMGRPKRQG
jgi:hypothetical protein